MTELIKRTVSFEQALEEVQNGRLLSRDDVDGGMTIHLISDSNNRMWYYIFPAFGEVTILPFDRP